MNAVAESNTGVSPPIVLLGVTFDNVTTAQTVALIEQMVDSRQPHHLVTANVDFLVQAQQDVELHRILTDAHMVLCDGMPLVWASRLLGNALPERVAGSDLAPLLLQAAAKKKFRVFFLGGTSESIDGAVRNLQAKYPDLIIAGHYSPPFAPLLEMDHDEICRRVQEAKPDLLFVSFGCPKQEKWIAMHYRSLGVPVAVGVGATIDFLAGRVRRAPRWMQRTGTEWIFRLLQEPRRLAGRYFRGLRIFAWAILRQWWRMQLSRTKTPCVLKTTLPARMKHDWKRVRLPERLDSKTVRRDGMVCEQALATSRQCLFDLSKVKFIDSTGVGLLVSLQKRARITNRHIILLSPSQSVRSALKLMRLEDFFVMAADLPTAIKLLEPQSRGPVLLQANYFPSKPSIFWQGEITAMNVEQVWRSTLQHLSTRATAGRKFLIDLSSLQFIDSSGVGLMVRAKKIAWQQGLELVFTGIQPKVRNVLHFARAESFLLGAG